MPAAPPTDSVARRLGLAACLLALPAFGLVAWSLGMDADWDLRNYHYYNAYAFLNGRWGWDLLVSQIPSFYNPTVDLPYYLLEQVLPARVLGFGLGALHGLNFALLYVLARRLIAAPPLTRTLAALGVALAGVTGAEALSEVGAVFYDNVASLGVYASVLLVVARLDRLTRGRLAEVAPWAALAGLPVGLAMGLKQPMMIYALGSCFALLAVPTSPRRRLELAFFFGLGVLAGLGLGGGHWMWSLWRHYGNPLFPYFNHVFKSPWGLPMPYRDTMYLQDTLWDKLTFAVSFSLSPRKAGEVVFRDFRILALYLTLLGVAATALVRAARHRPAPVPPDAAVRYLLTMAAITYAVWVQMFCIYRYLVPLEMLAPLLIVLALKRLPLPAKAWPAVAAMVLAGLMAATQPASWYRAPWQDKAVTVDALPAIADPPHTLVLLAGHEPLSFLLPFFPPEMRFVRIDSTFTNIRETENAFNPLMLRLVTDHQGPLAMLFITWEERDIHAKLDEYGLHLDRARCQPVTSPIGPAAYAYCPAVRGRVWPVPLNPQIPAHP